MIVVDLFCFLFFFFFFFFIIILICFFLLFSIYSPSTGVFTRVAQDMPLGPSWYPTTCHLPDGNVLIAGGFTAYTCSPICTNPSLVMFNVTRYDQGKHTYNDKEWKRGQ
jgi:hypothetical protein